MKKKALQKQVELLAVQLEKERDEKMLLNMEKALLTFEKNTGKEIFPANDSLYPPTRFSTEKDVFFFDEFRRLCLNRAVIKVDGQKIQVALKHMGGPTWLLNVTGDDTSNYPTELHRVVNDILDNELKGTKLDHISFVHEGMTTTQPIDLAYDWDLHHEHKIQQLPWYRRFLAKRFEYFSPLKITTMNNPIAGEVPVCIAVI